MFCINALSLSKESLLNNKKISSVKDEIKQFRGTNLLHRISPACFQAQSCSIAITGESRHCLIRPTQQYNSKTIFIKFYLILFHRMRTLFKDSVLLLFFSTSFYYYEICYYYTQQKNKMQVFFNFIQNFFNFNPTKPHSISFSLIIFDLSAIIYNFIIHATDAYIFRKTVNFLLKKAI